MIEYTTSLKDKFENPDTKMTTAFDSLNIELVGPEAITGERLSKWDFWGGGIASGDSALIDKWSESIEGDKWLLGRHRYQEGLPGNYDQIIVDAKSEAHLWELLVLRESEDTAQRLFALIDRLFGWMNKITCINQRLVEIPERELEYNEEYVYVTNGGLVRWTFSGKYWDWRIVPGIEVVL